MQIHFRKFSVRIRKIFHPVLPHASKYDFFFTEYTFCILRHVRSAENLSRSVVEFTEVYLSRLILTTHVDIIYDQKANNGTFQFFASVIEKVNTRGGSGRGYRHLPMEGHSQPRTHWASLKILKCPEYEVDVISC